MNTGLQALTRNWFRQDQGDNDMPDDHDTPPPPPIPVIATIPMPEQTEDEKRLKTIADAHGYVEQIKQERLADSQKIKRLESEKADVEDQFKKEQRKSGLLELDLATALNNLQTLESRIYEYRNFMSTWKRLHDQTGLVFEKFNIEAPPKPERKPKVKKKADREGSDQTAKADSA